MPDGHIKDPRMNTEEKDFGILISCTVTEERTCKEVIYLKDEISRSFTCGTPVVFELQTRQVLYDQNHKDKGYVTVEVATNVRVNEETIANHKIISQLNEAAKVMLEGSS